MLKFTISKTETRIIRAMGREIGGTANGISRSVENRCELHEKLEMRLDVTCELPLIPKDAPDRMLKAITQALKKLFLKLLTVLRFRFTL